MELIMIAVGFITGCLISMIVIPYSARKEIEKLERAWRDDG